MSVTSPMLLWRAGRAGANFNGGMDKNIDKRAGNQLRHSQHAEIPRMVVISVRCGPTSLTSCSPGRMRRLCHGGVRPRTSGTAVITERARLQHQQLQARRRGGETGRDP